MAKPITKIPVRCPHCGAEQLEPELAKSTFCRSCSQYFAITPQSQAGKQSASSVKAPSQPSRTSGAASSSTTPQPSLGPSISASVGGSGLFQKLEGYFSKPKVQVVQCFDCPSTQEVNGNAHSTTCRACGTYIDLQDYKINGSFSRNIKTRGSVFLGPKGDLSSNKVICTDAVIYGKMRGSMYCSGRVTIKYQGRLQGTLEAGVLLIEKGSEVVFSRPLKVASVTIAGKMNGQIISKSHIVIHKTGTLEGAAIATGFNVERGGCFQGELTISPPGVALPEAGEIAIQPLPEVKPKSTTPNLANFLGGEQNPVLG